MEMLEDVFPGSVHVNDIDMHESADTAIWEYAGKEGFTIVSKDSDFHQRSFVKGHPPKVIWIQRGNCSTSEMFELLHDNRKPIEAFGNDNESSFLILE